MRIDPNDGQTEWKSGKPETPCGKGSMFANTGQVRSILNEIVNQYQIGTIADVGCGDQNWVHDSLPDSVEYTGFDIRPRYVDVVPFDVTIQILPEAFDLILCICLINHLKNPWRPRAYRTLKLSGSRLLLCSYLKDQAPPFELMQQWTHESTDAEQERKKRKAGHIWKYGLWRMNDA